MLTFVTVPGSCRLFLKMEALMQEGFEKAGKLRSEFVVAVVGTVEKRGGAVNDKSGNR